MVATHADSRVVGMRTFLAMISNVLYRPVTLLLFLFLLCIGRLGYVEAALSLLPSFLFCFFTRIKRKSWKYADYYEFGINRQYKVEKNKEEKNELVGIK